MRPDIKAIGLSIVVFSLSNKFQLAQLLPSYSFKVRLRLQGELTIWYKGAPLLVTVNCNYFKVSGKIKILGMIFVTRQIKAEENMETFYVTVI